MKKILIALNGLFLVLGACSHVSKDADLKASADYMDQVEEACKNTQDNHLLAQSQCFPLLQDKALTVRVREISKSLTLVGEMGASDARILCQPSSALIESLRANPKQVGVGDKLRVRGKFSKASLGFISDYTLENCTFTRVTDEVQSEPIS